MKVLIVDDEAPARAKLKRFLEELRPGIQLQEACDGVGAMNLLESQAFDLVLLDIQMPGMTGIEVVDAYGTEELPPIIFTTAYDQYAVKAFEQNAVDYLLKPFDLERFEKALAKVESSSQRRGDEEKSQLLDRLLTDLASETYLERLIIKDRGKITPVPVSQILWLEADDKYVRVHLADTKHIIRNTISSLEGRLDPKQFSRTHRSSIVNLNYIQELEPISHGDYVIRMKNGDTLNLSRRYAHKLGGFWGD